MYYLISIFDKIKKLIRDDGCDIMFMSRLPIRLKMYHHYENGPDIDNYILPNTLKYLHVVNVQQELTLPNSTKYLKINHIANSKGIVLPIFVKCLHISTIFNMLPKITNVSHVTHLIIDHNLPFTCTPKILSFNYLIDEYKSLKYLYTNFDIINISEKPDNLIVKTTNSIKISIFDLL
jgi:hypothetical protein